MTPLKDIPFTKMDGGTATLADYAGDVILVVNVASFPPSAIMRPFFNRITRSISGMISET